MPLYEYSCQSCDERFEVLQRLGAGPEGLTCPSCGWAKLSREVSSFSSTGTSRAIACAPRGGFT